MQDCAGLYNGLLALQETVAYEFGAWVVLVGVNLVMGRNWDMSYDASQSACGDSKLDEGRRRV